MKIFINYRREDSSWAARYIADKLSASYGEEEVFIDERNIDAGDKISFEIESKLKSTRVLIVLITYQWIKVQNEAGKRRIDADDDWVRKEIEACLNRKECLVIPVLLDGADLPETSHFPESIKLLSDRKTIKIEKNNTSSADMLLKTIDDHLGNENLILSNKQSNKIIYESLSRRGKLNLSDFENPYNHIFDPDSYPDRNVYCTICFPKVDFITNTEKTIQMPAVAFCFDASIEINVKSMMSEDLYNKFIKYSPAKLFNEDKESILKCFSRILDNGFVAGVTLPAMLFTSKVAKRKCKQTYSALINSLIKPLIDYHDNIEYRFEKIEIASVGFKEIDKGLLSTLTSEIDREASLIKNKEVESLVRMLIWCIGSAINNGNKNWVKIIKEG